MRIYVKGFGCSSSLSDTEVIAGCLSKAGHAIVNNLDEAELVLYNTCAVKAPTENRMISIMKRSRGKRLVVAGCLPLINFERLQREIHFDAAVGPAFGERIVDVVGQVLNGEHVVSLDNSRISIPSLGLPRIRANPYVSIIPISYGCLGSCSYCCVRFARGKLRSHSVEEVVSKVERDAAEGIREFWLTAQDTACYGMDVGTSLPTLLERVCEVNGDFFVRVGMMTPNSLLRIIDDYIDAMKNEKVFKFLHLPIQSGDDNVLRRMNRLYSSGDFLDILDKFRAAFPLSTVATDVIVGFPGETEEAFMHSVELVERIRPDIVNVSKFFARPRAEAADFELQIPASEVKRRSARLARLARIIALECNRGWKGWSGRILVDELGKPGSVVGRNFAYKPVVVRCDHGRGLLGKYVVVKVVDAFQSHLLGEIA